MSLTKVDLAQDIEDELGYNTARACEATNTIVDVVKKAIFDKKMVYIPKHMKIVSSIKDERPGRNPKTGEDHTIEVKHSIRAVKGTFSGMDYKLTKHDFIDELVEKGYLNKEATVLVEVFYKFVGKIKDGKARIEIRGFGSFRSEFRKARTVRNPKTGDKIDKEDFYQPMFKCSDSLRKAMDKAYL